VREHQHRVRKHKGKRVEREYMLRRFQDPASRRFARSLKMTEEPRKEPIAVVLARRVEPGSKRKPPPPFVALSPGIRMIGPPFLLSWHDRQLPPLIARHL
jgi:hypothetical protein